MQKIIRFSKKAAFIAFYFSLLSALAFGGGMLFGKNISQQGGKKVIQVVHKSSGQPAADANVFANGDEENDIEKIASGENKEENSGDKNLEGLLQPKFSLGKVGALQSGTEAISGKIQEIILGKNEISAGIKAAAGDCDLAGNNSPCGIPRSGSGFAAIPQGKENFSFAVIGDIQRFSGDPNEDYPKAVAKIKGANPSLVLAVGDLVGSCGGGAECEGKFRKIKEVLGPLMPKFYSAMGNHDRTGRGKADAAWQSVFEFPTNGPANYEELTYSFDFGGSHFVFLNSERPKQHVVNKNQRDWLEADLVNYQKSLSAGVRGNIFVFFHEPAYPVSSKIGESLDAEKKDRDALWEVFKKYKVTAVFNGHEHIHSRRNIGGVYQFVVGNTESFDHDAANKNAEYSYRGRHYAIIEVSGQEVTVNIYTIEGLMINSFSIPR